MLTHTESSHRIHARCFIRSAEHVNRGRVHADQAACAQPANDNGRRDPGHLRILPPTSLALDRPLVVVAATKEALARWLSLQDSMATLSTNSSHRVVPHTHDALVNDKTAAETSSQAIRDVVHAVPSDAPLEES